MLITYAYRLPADTAHASLPTEARQRAPATMPLSRPGEYFTGAIKLTHLHQPTTPLSMSYNIFQPFYLTYFVKCDDNFCF